MPGQTFTAAPGLPLKQSLGQKRSFHPDNYRGTCNSDFLTVQWDQVSADLHREGRGSRLHLSRALRLGSRSRASASPGVVAARLPPEVGMERADCAVRYCRNVSLAASFGHRRRPSVTAALRRYCASAIGDDCQKEGETPMRSKILALTAAVAIGTVTMTTGAMAFRAWWGSRRLWRWLRPWGLRHGPRRLRRRIRTRFLRKRLWLWRLWRLWLGRLWPRFRFRAGPLWIWMGLPYYGW
jgi:hypothetical protein